MKAFFLLSCLLLFMASVSSETSQVGPPDTTTLSATETTSPSTEQTTASTETTSPSTEQTTASTETTSPSTEQTTASTETTSPSTEQTTASTETTSPSTEQTTASTETTSPSTEQTTASTETTSPSTEQSTASTQTNGPNTEQITNSTQPSDNTTVSKNPCAVKGCGDASTCIILNTEAFCLCPEGFYYDSTCKKGKTFPGIITTTDNISDLEDRTSLEYQNLHFKIENFFKKAFINETAYGQTVIIKLQTSSISKSVMRSMGEVTVTVMNLFDQTSAITIEKVNEAIKKEAEGNGNISYEEKDPCEFNGCSKNSGDCTDISQCQCEEGLARPTPWSSCSTCSSECKKVNNKQCVQNLDSSHVECKCLPGYKKKDNECQKCDFGYNGVECKDSYLLALVVVCCVGGAILLSTIIITVIVITRSKGKKSTERDTLIDKDFSNVRMETTGFTNPGASGGLFPKVRTTQYPSNQSNIRNNPYENPYSRRSIPARDY